MGNIFGFGGSEDPDFRGSAVFSLTELGKDALGRGEGSGYKIMILQALDNMNQATAVAISKETHLDLLKVKALLQDLVYERYVRKTN